MDYRAEPQVLANEGAEAPDPVPDAQGNGGDRLGRPGDFYGPSPAAMPGNGSSDPAATMASPAQPGGRGYIPSAQAAGAAAGAGAAGAMRMPSPYPSVGTPSGPMARITAPFSGLTKPKTKPARPAKPAPAKSPKSSAQKRSQAPAQQAPLPGGVSQRKAQLVLSRIEPWSVMKFSFMISLVGWVVLFVAVAAIYFVLSRLGVFTQIEHTVGLVTSTKDTPGTDASSWFASSRVLGYTMLAGAVNVVLITALATVGAVVYNLVTHLAGGIEVTLKETD